MGSGRSIVQIRQSLDRAAQLTSDGDVVTGALRDLGTRFRASVAAIYGVGDGPRGPQPPGNVLPLSVKRFVEIREKQSEALRAPAADEPTRAAESLFRSSGFDRQLTAPLNQVPYGAPGWMGLVLYRSEVQRPWTRRDERALGLLVPSVTALVRETMRRREAEHGREVLTTALEDLAAKPTLVFDESAAVVWISAEARAILARRLGRTGQLDEPLRPAVESLLKSRGMRLDVTDLVDGLKVTLSLAAPPREGGRAAVLARLAPLEEDALGVAREGTSAALSPAELAVAHWLQRGLSNREIGRKLFVSENTVRAHLRQIFQKLNVRSRVEAVLRLQG